jgi:hypothetical protein
LRFGPRQTSFGTIGLGVGLTLLVAGFLGYFNFVGGSNADNSVSALLLIYGFPISLIGAAAAASSVSETWTHNGAESWTSSPSSFQVSP